MFNNVTTGYDMSDATWEIIIMLLVAFILGFILRHLFCCSPSSSQGKTKQTKNTTTRVAQAFASAGIAEPAAGSPAVTAVASPVEAASKPESLQRVEGIGPKIEGLLWAGGILTMRQLATADLGAIQKVLDDAGPRYRMHKPKSWSTQAELIADEKWDELKKYQDFLVAGRE